MIVADDDDAVRAVLSEVLDDAGFDVVGAAADGTELVALAASLRPDAIVLDVRMPRMGGIEAARRIRAVDDGVRLTMLSAYEDPMLQRDAMDAGATRFLIKGCPLSELVEAIAR
ncbi:MAG: response regulator [Gaiellaceae bacterium]